MLFGTIFNSAFHWSRTVWTKAVQPHLHQGFQFPAIIIFSILHGDGRKGKGYRKGQLILQKPAARHAILLLCHSACLWSLWSVCMRASSTGTTAGGTSNWGQLLQKKSLSEVNKLRCSSSSLVSTALYKPSSSLKKTKTISKTKDRVGLTNCVSLTWCRKTTRKRKLELIQLKSCWFHATLLCSKMRMEY